MQAHSPDCVEIGFGIIECLICGRVGQCWRTIQWAIRTRLQIMNDQVVDVDVTVRADQSVQISVAGNVDHIVVTLAVIVAVVAIEVALLKVTLL